MNDENISTVPDTEQSAPIQPRMKYKLICASKCKKFALEFARQQIRTKKHSRVSEEFLVSCEVALKNHILSRVKMQPTKGKTLTSKFLLDFFLKPVTVTTMQIDLEVLKTNGQQHIDQIIESLKEEAWKSVSDAKFSNSPPEELEVMKNIWSHGFMRGAEAATRVTTEIYDLLNKPKV